MTQLIVEMEMPRACPCELAIEIEGNFYPCFAYYGVVERAVEFDACVANGTRPGWCPIKRELPVSIGDVVWLGRYGKVEKCKVSMLYQKADGTWKLRITDEYGYVSDFRMDDIGKIDVFLTREQAVAAAERKDNGTTVD